MENAATGPAREWGALPRLGAQLWVDPKAEAAKISGGRTGYVQHVDMAALQGIAEDHELTIHIEVLAGSFVHPARVVAQISPPTDAGYVEAIRDCFSIGADREYEQDPRFGLIVLSEIASRALSPAINDPGTAIEVIGAGLRVMLEYADGRRDVKPFRFNKLHARDLKMSDLFNDFFNPIARDGAGLIEVQMRIQSALEALADSDPALYSSCAREHAGRALARGLEALTLAEDKRCLEERSVWAKSSYNSQV